MKNHTKLICALLAIMIAIKVFTVAPFTASAAELSLAEGGASPDEASPDEAQPCSGTTGSCTWSLDGTKLTISGDGTMKDDYSPWGKTITEVTINAGVTSIGEAAFYGCTALTSIEIPDSVTSIGGSAFSDCSNMTSVTIPDSVASIGMYAFSDTAWYSHQPDGLVYAGKVAYSMKGNCPPDVIIKEGTLSITGNAFYGCSSLTSVTIPDSVTSIGDYAFYECKGLSSVRIGNSVTSIGRWAFGNCSYLSNLIYPENVSYVGSGAFSNTTWLDKQPNGLIYIGKVAYKYKGEAPEEVTIKEGTVSIAECALQSQEELKTLVIPDSVKDIGSMAIRYTGLTTISIPESVTYIGDQAFYYCANLTSITIPESVEIIGNGAFSECVSLKSITIHGNNTVIGSQAFYLCHNLSDVILDEGIKSIDSYAFLNCDNLKRVYIPKSVTEIQEYAFGYSGDTKIDSFTIHGYTGTEAERYANDNGFTFITLDDTETISVDITKTNIKADSAFNNDGYGSLRINPSTNDGQSVSPQAALIDSSGTLLFPYKDTQHRYYVSDGIVSLISGPYTNYVDDPIGFYTPDGNMAFEGDYYGATNMKDGYAFVTMDCNSIDSSVKSYLIDQNGQVVTELQDGFNQLVYFGAGDTFSRISAKDNTSATLFGDLLLCWSYASLADYCDGVIESIYYMDRNGQKVLELPVSEYSFASGFSDGLAAVQSAYTGKWGYIDKTGEPVIPCQYDACGYFADGIVNTRLDNKWGYINAKNEVVIPFAYDAAFGAGSGLASVGKGGKYGLVDYNNNIVVPFEYDDISSFEGGAAYAVKDGYVYIITEKAEQEPVLLGDADGDEKVTILDATAIQRHLASLSTSAFVEKAADADGDGKITILDATAIQRHLANLPTNKNIGKNV